LLSSSTGITLENSMAKEAVIQIADTHVNSTLGLCKPGLVRDDGDPYDLNTIQRWLLKSWEQCLDDIGTLTKGYYRSLVVDGDAIEVDTKDRSWQIISRNPSTALGLAIDIFDPLVTMCDTSFFLRGTEAHTGKSGWAEEALAKDFGSERDPATTNYSWWHLRAKFSGVSFDIAHHYSMGQLPWTFGNSAMKLAATAMWDYMEWEEKPPDIVVRAHNHRFADSGRTYPTRAVFLPCWQWHTAHLHRLGKANARPHIGAVVFLCDKGEYTFHELLYRPTRSTPWVRKS
jgi:hypothetical protein